jgi:predicted HNH restriction endonuclease
VFFLNKFYEKISEEFILVIDYEEKMKEGKLNAIYIKFYERNNSKF